MLPSLFFSMDLSSLPPSPERSVSAVGSESKVTNGVEGKTPNGVEDKATNGVEDVQNLQEEQRLKDPNLVIMAQPYLEPHGYRD